MRNVLVEITPDENVRPGDLVFTRLDYTEWKSFIRDSNGGFFMRDVFTYEKTRRVVGCGAPCLVIENRDSVWVTLMIPGGFIGNLKREFLTRVIPYTGRRSLSPEP